MNVRSLGVVKGLENEDRLVVCLGDHDSGKKEFFKAVTGVEPSNDSFTMAKISTSHSVELVFVCTPDIPPRTEDATTSLSHFKEWITAHAKTGKLIGAVYCYRRVWYDTKHQHRVDLSAFKSIRAAYHLYNPVVPPPPPSSSSPSATTGKRPVVPQIAIGKGWSDEGGTEAVRKAFKETGEWEDERGVFRFEDVVTDKGIGDVVAMVLQYCPVNSSLWAPNVNTQVQDPKHNASCIDGLKAILPL